MKDFNDYLPSTKEIIKNDIESLKEQGYMDGGKDATMNYLYFLRDFVNEELKKTRKA